MTFGPPLRTSVTSNLIAANSLGLDVNATVVTLKRDVGLLDTNPPLQLDRLNRAIFAVYHLMRAGYNAVDRSHPSS